MGLVCGLGKMNEYCKNCHNRIVPSHYTKGKWTDPTWYWGLQCPRSDFGHEPGGVPLRPDLLDDDYDEGFIIETDTGVRLPPAPY